MSQALDIASWVLLVSGGLFCVISAVGVLRLPDFYTRTHGASIADTLGATLIVLGLVLQSTHWLVVVKLLLVLVFLFFTSPTAGHALVKAAYAHGVKALNEEEDHAS